jgi:ABC-type polysaccharide/polyol phosphate transport system ATPase subunit
VDELKAPTVDDAWRQYVTDRPRRRAVIEMKGLGVRYGGSAGDHGVRALAARVMGRRPRPPVWGLRDVDLTVRAGECLGVIGPNGAGKSTLLRVIAGLIEHDTGTLRVRGRLSALLNLGVGFDPLLTGRENVRLVASLMGLSRRQSRERVPQAIDFAEIGDFIDAPLRTYSSGMRARLGFAAAVTLVEPHVLILDEVMGTGDAAFRERSRDRVMELVQHAHAVLVASHDMAWVSEFANYAVLLDRGAIVAEGAPSGVTTLHRARAVKPPRRFGCGSCAGQSTDTWCDECGVWRRDAPDHPG